MALSHRVKSVAATGSKFLLVGGLSTVIEIGVMNLCFLVLGWDPVLSKLIASTVALVNAYFGNREWAFRGRKRRDRRSEIVWFLGVNVFCLALGALLLWIGVELGGVILGRAAGPFAVNVINLVSIALVVVVRFGLYHLLVFRVPRGTEPPSDA